MCHGLDSAFTGGAAADGQGYAEGKSWNGQEKLTAILLKENAMENLLLELTRELIDLKLEKKKFDKEMTERIKDVEKRIEAEAIKGGEKS